VLALFYIKEDKTQLREKLTEKAHEAPKAPYHNSIIQGENTLKSPPLSWNIFLIPVGLSCAQGILTFELPLMVQNNGSIMTTGLLFTVISLGSLITLCMLFINRFNPAYRTVLGSISLAIFYFLLATDAPIPFMGILLLIGMSKGIVFPALSHWLIQLSNGQKYGRTFSILAIASSIGAFLGPFLAGQLRDFISPYFISFVMLTLALAFNALPDRKSPNLSSKLL